MTAPTTPSAPALEGEFTIFTAVELKTRWLQLIEENQDTPLEISLAGVTDMDSAGLQLMVMTVREAAIRGKPLRFVEPSAAVLELLELCNLSGLLEQQAMPPFAV